MAPSFKIAFPLPGFRPSSSTQTTPSPHKDVDDSPPYYPSPKAEEILGASTPDGNVTKKSKSKKERKHLRKFPSFMNVTLADIEGDSPGSDEGFPFPGVQTTSSMHPSTQSHVLPGQRLSRHGSSPLLGETRTVIAAGGDYFNVQSPQKSHQNESASPSPHLDYQRPQSPTVASQQTWASSTRDSASRRGLPQVSSPLAHQTKMSTSTVNTANLSRTHSRNISKESERSDGSKISGSSKIAAIPRRRPSVMDRPTLYPEAPRPIHAVSPPPALINSSLPRHMQIGGGNLPAAGKSRWWGMRRTKTSPHEPEEVLRQHPDGADVSPVKVNVKKPRAGVRNWFDTIDTDDAALETTSLNDQYSRFEPANTDNFESNVATEPASIEHVLFSDPPTSPQPSQRKSSLSSKGRRSGPSDRKLSFKLDCPAQRSSQGRTSSYYSSKSAPISPGTSKSIQSTDSQRGIPEGLDLQLHSILNLSSSEDEDEQSLDSSTRRQQVIRASVEGSDYSGEVLYGNTLRGQTIRPRQVSGRNSKRSSSSRKSNASEVIPPVPQIPSRPQLTQRSSSMRWKEVLEEKETAQSIGTTTEAEAGDETVDSGGSSLTDITVPTATPQATPSTRPVSKRLSNSHRGSKLMKVTLEEEKLLEAMREKRASIRANDFQKGFTSAMQQLRASDLISRPRTAGADGTGPPSRSSLYGHTTTGSHSSRGSMSPPILNPTVYRPPGGLPLYQHHPYKNSLSHNSRLSISAEDLTIDDSYPFPQIPSEPLPSLLSANTNIRSPIPSYTAANAAGAIAKLDSPNLSLTFSTAESSNGAVASGGNSFNGKPQPSTPSTRNSPLTPPPGHNNLGVYGINRSTPINSLGHHPDAAALIGIDDDEVGPRMGYSPAIGMSNLLTLPLPPLPPAKSDKRNSFMSTNTTSTGKATNNGVIVRTPINGVNSGSNVDTHVNMHSSVNQAAKTPGHGRHHTSSSSVVVLDGVETYAAAIDEETEIAGWGMDMERW